MNNDRRKILRRVEDVLDAVQAEIDVLATDESVGEKESSEKRDERVKGWQGRLTDAMSDLEGARDDEEEAAENTVGEDAKAEKEEAVAEMTECHEDLEELTSLEDLGQFNEMWSSKYDSMVQNLQNAGQ